MVYIYLTGDIGGTNSRLILNSSPTLTGNSPPLTILKKKYLNSNHNNLYQIINSFISDCISSFPEIKISDIFIAVFCIAGPVENQSCTMTNLNWFISSSEIVQKTSLQLAHIQNDFKSIGYGVLHLAPKDYIPVLNRTTEKEKVLAVIGAGTGLGQCFVTYDSQGERYVHSSEGGHSDFPVFKKEDFEILEYFLKDLGTESDGHLSTERVVSGNGLQTLFRFFSEKEGLVLDKELIKNFERSGKCLGFFIAENCFGKETSKLRLVCRKTVYKLLEIFAMQTANVCVMFIPKGGVFLAGGIIVRIFESCKSEDDKKWVIESFKENLFRKGRMNKIMNKIQINIIVNEDIGLVGASYVGLRFYRDYVQCDEKEQLMKHDTL